MKILQTNKAYAPLVGGIETTITNLAEGISGKSGMEVEVLVCNHERSFRAVSKTMNGVPVTYVPAWGTLASLPISPAYPRFLAGIKADILHVHEPFPLADLAILSFPTIARNFSHIVISWHGDIVRQQWALPLYRPLFHKFMHKVERILVSAPGLIDSSEFISRYRDRCEIIPLGVRLDWVKSSHIRLGLVREIKGRQGTPLVLFVGRLVYYKGLRYLLEAMTMVPEASLVIIGSGPLRDSVNADIAGFGLRGRITVIPFATDDELHAYYEACDLLVLPSTERSEAYGLVQVEAMACGKPVVSTRLGTGVTFVNQDGITGLTVPPRNSRALAEALKRLTGDPDLRLTLGRNAQERALREFSASRMVDRTVEVYERLMGS